MAYNVFHVIKDFLTGNLKQADEQTIAARLEICNSCEVRNELANVCTACGCYIPAKTALAKSSCPLEKW